MIQDLCVIMLTAGVTSLLFKLFKQPVVLGYIVAGMIAGPYMCGESWITDEHSVDTWSEIGVLFLLFALGLEFSFKKLLQIGGTALIAATTIAIGMMTLGFFTGRMFGWDEMNSLFLGGMLCMSSTTIVFKAINDQGLQNNKFANICFGILIVEDIFAVVLMVMLSSIAVKRSFEGTEMLLQVGKLAAYLVFWFVVGIAIIPTFLKRFKKYLNDETLTIFSIGLCLGMVLLAVGAGFSSALGAFVMGSVLAETVEAERIEHLVQPIKNVFGAIFFVSVGMMINPSELSVNWLPIVVISCVVIIGQILFGSIGTLLSGQTLKVSLQSGFSLVQIGEFAFIIASLGLTLGVTDKTLYPIVVAVSVLTTFLTPYIMRLADPAYKFIDKRMGPGTKMFLENYARSRNTVSMQGVWERLLKKVVKSLVIYGVITAFVIILYKQYVNPIITDALKDIMPRWGVRSISLLILLSVTSPFIYTMATRHRRSSEAIQLWKSGSIQKASLTGIRLLRIVVCTGFIVYETVSVFGTTSGFIIALSAVFIILMMLSNRINKQSRRMEMKFTENLQAREKSANKRRSIRKDFENTLLSYDLHISVFQLPVESRFSGKTLSQLDIRKGSGVSVVRIIRGGININIPGGKERIFPMDQIVVAGTDEQISSFRKLLDASVNGHNNDEAPSRITLERFSINANSPLIGISIIDSGIREKANCTIMGIERNGSYIMNPEPTLQFSENDIVIVAGETESIANYISKVEQ
jgi:CPA2 family monovalent cation:H+ antiporter-2